MIRRRRGAPAIELYKACSGANDGPWRQSGVLQEPRVQLLRGLDAPIDDRPRCRRRGKGISVSFAVGRQSRWRTTTRQSAPLRRIGTFGLAVGAACAFSLGIAGQVLTFHTRATAFRASRRLHRRMPLGQSQCIPQAYPGRMGQPPVLTSSNRISTLLQRFACARLSQSCLSKSCSDFSATFTTIAFDDSSLRWLEIST